MSEPLQQISDLGEKIIFSMNNLLLPGRIHIESFLTFLRKEWGWDTNSCRQPRANRSERRPPKNNMNLYSLKVIDILPGGQSCCSWCPSHLCSRLICTAKLSESESNILKREQILIIKSTLQRNFRMIFLPFHTHTESLDLDIPVYPRGILFYHHDIVKNYQVSNLVSGSLENINWMKIITQHTNALSTL